MGCKGKKYQKGGNVPPERGAPLTLSDLLPAIGRAMALERKIGDTGEAFNVVSGARSGNPALSAKVADVLQPDLTMHELTGAQRYLQGKELGESMGIPLASWANLVYTGDKALSQWLGRKERFIPIDDTKLDESTSQASLANLLAAQAGILAHGHQGGGPVSSGPQPSQNQRSSMPKASFRVPTVDMLDIFRTQAIPQFQSGGLVGDLINQLRNLNVDTSQIGAMAQNLSGLGGKMAGFDPFGGGGLGGTASNTLQQMLTTGSPVDVSPITEAAKQQAGLTFQDLMQGTNESFGALGLGSSSARQQQLAKQASNLAQGVGIAGLQAGVGAEEAARNRQMGAFSPFLAGTAQQLGGMTGASQNYLGAGGLYGTQAGLGLQQQLGKTGGMQNVLGSQMPAYQQQITQPPAPYPMQNPVSGYSPGGGGGGYAGGGGGGIHRGGGLGGTKLGINYGRGPIGFQSGGSVGKKEDYGDYLSKLLYGKEFARRAPVQMQPQPMPQYGMSNLGPMLQQMMSQAPKTSSKPGGAFTASSFIDPMLPYIETMPGLNPSASAQQPWRNFAMSMGPNNWAQYLAMALAGKQGGGKVAGPAVPPDQVPILAQGGEGVLNVQQMHDLEQSKSEDPLIKNMKDTMGFQGGGEIQGPGFSYGPQGYTITDPTQAAQAMGGTGTFSQMGVVETPEEKLNYRRALAEKRLALLRSAIATAANVERATALLTPRIEEAQGELTQIAGEQDALRARQQEQLRTAASIAQQQIATEGQKEVEQMRGAQREKEAEAVGEAAQQQQQAQEMQAFREMVAQLMKPDEMGMSMPVEEAMKKAAQVFMGPQAGQMGPELPAPDGIESALEGASYDSIQDDALPILQGVYQQLLQQGLSAEEVDLKYPNLSRILQDLVAAGRI